jgi:Zn-finger nucleic acid-binding protein
MKCPNCEAASLISVDLDQDLLALRCGKCEGHWLPAFQYWRWLQSVDSPASTESENTPRPEPGFEREKARLCPECHRLLLKYKVGKGISFALDRCSFCGGFWFDRAEWEILRERGLHQGIHLIFAAAWQRQVRQERREKSLRTALGERLGASDFARATEFKAWLTGHPARQEITAYLADPEL